MHLTVRTDGGARGNPGPAAAGVCIEDQAGKVLFSGGFFLGETTNNVAEYEGIIRGLTEAVKLGATEVTLYCDSELVTKQLTGKYRVKHPKMMICFEKVAEIRKNFEKITFIHVLRHKNTHADAMVNESLDMGCDVGGIGNSPSQTPSSREDFAVEPLSEKIQFDDPSRWRDSVSRNGAMATDLICLKDGQAESFPINARQGSLCVLRGAGQITIDSTSQEIQAGGWISLEQGQNIKLQAGQQKEFVLLLTLVV